MADPALSTNGARGVGRVVRRIYQANLVAQIDIVVTGGLVRLTGSGLGCPTWPECVDGSLTPTSAQEESIGHEIKEDSELLAKALGGAVPRELWCARAL